MIVLYDPTISLEHQAILSVINTILQTASGTVYDFIFCSAKSKTIWRIINKPSSRFPTTQ